MKSFLYRNIESWPESCDSKHYELSKHLNSNLFMNFSFSETVWATQIKQRLRSRYQINTLIKIHFQIPNLRLYTADNIFRILSLAIQI